MKDDVMAMRRRMRGELDRSQGLRFDLKQGEGGLVDLEFLVQERVLACAAHSLALCEPRDTPGLLRALAEAGALPGVELSALLAAHAALLSRGLDCTLDRRPRIVPEDETVAAARACVRAACRSQGLAFSAG